jgi:hypothetical protein
MDAFYATLPRIENSAGQDIAISYHAALKAAKSLEEAQEVVSVCQKNN